nr:MAG TPA: hypothetical protein [Caudoviricetes sp.]
MSKTNLHFSDVCSVLKKSRSESVSERVKSQLSFSFDT